VDLASHDDLLDALAFEGADHAPQLRRSSPVETLHQGDQFRRCLAANSNTDDRQSHASCFVSEGDGKSPPAGEQSNRFSVFSLRFSVVAYHCRCFHLKTENRKPITDFMPRLDPAPAVVSLAGHRGTAPAIFRG